MPRFSRLRVVVPLVGEFQKAKRGLRLVIPDEWHISIVREGDAYRLVYKEVLSKPEDLAEDVFRKAVADSVAFVRVLAEPLGGKVYEGVADGKRVITFEAKGTLDVVAGFLASEFVSLSGLGELSLKDLFVFAGFGAVQLFSKERLIGGV